MRSVHILSVSVSPPVILYTSVMLTPAEFFSPLPSYKPGPYRGAKPDMFRISSKLFFTPSELQPARGPAVKSPKKMEQRFTRCCFLHQQWYVYKGGRR